MTAPHRSRPARAGRQQGVVLIIALIMLVVVSMLATLSIRSATSTEAVAGNVRTTQLATQSAEIALRYCEDTLATVHKTPGSAPAGWVESSYSATPYYTDLTTNWDVNPAPKVFVVPLTSVNAGSVTFKRPPECLIENVQVLSGTPMNTDTSTTYIITARGFGPEVPAADLTRSRPPGSEVWLQSTIELN